MIGKTSSIHPLRWVLAVLLGLLWTTTGSAAALAERGDFGHCSLAANSGGGGWRALPGGVRIKQTGNYWIKEENPDASGLAQWWGRGSLEAQARVEH